MSDWSKEPAKKINVIHYVPWKLLLVGAGLILIGTNFYVNATENDRDATSTWQGINWFISKNLMRSNIDLNFILNEDKSIIHIYYFTDNIKNNTFVAIELPYDGKLTEKNNGWTSLPREGGVTLIYKQFKCIGNMTNCNYHNYQNYYDEYEGNDQFNLLFEIDQLIDSKQFYTHSLNIPVGGAINSDVMGFIQFDIADGKNDSWQENWYEDVNVRLSVSVPDDSTEINLIPPAHPRALDFESSGKERTVYSWNITGKQTSHHIDYVNPQERSHYEDYRTWGIIFIGGGISIIGVFIGESKRIKIA